MESNNGKGIMECFEQNETAYRLYRPNGSSCNFVLNPPISLADSRKSGSFASEIEV